jgi:hypothetical protein
MNTKILQKCVEELKKETYSKEYVLGMLETIIEMNNNDKPLIYATTTPEIKGMVTHTNVDEAREEIPAFLRAA